MLSHLKPSKTKTDSTMVLLVDGWIEMGWMVVSKLGKVKITFSMLMT